jgi:hypothetical protein
MSVGAHRVIGTTQITQVVNGRHQPGPGQSELVLGNHQRYLWGKGEATNSHGYDQCNKTTQGNS